MNGSRRATCVARFLEPPLGRAGQLVRLVLPGLDEHSERVCGRLVEHPRGHEVGPGTDSCADDSGTATGCETTTGIP